MSAGDRRLFTAFAWLLVATACSTSEPETQGTTSEAATSSDWLSADQLAALARGAGLPCDKVVLATAIGLGESDGYRYATHDNDDGSVDRGLWQINSLAWPMYDSSCVFDPACNASAMAAISGIGGSFSPWVAYTNGRYQQFLGDANAADARGVPGCSGGGGGTSIGATCTELGYAGECVGSASLWSENGTCRVRNCAAEGKSCGLVSNAAGWGCVGGTAGARVSDCASLGYAGACMGTTLVWAENGRCRAVDCAATGRRCGADGANGQNCL